MQNGYSKDAIKVMFALLGAEVCGRQPDEYAKPQLTTELIEEIYSLSHHHDLDPIIGHALSKLGILGEDEFSQKLRQVPVWAVRRFIRKNYEYGRICKTLEQAMIPYIPLKGTVIRSLYPEPWMRTSCDIDILVKEESLEEASAALSENLKYTVGEKGEHDVMLEAGGDVRLELHYDSVQRKLAVNNSLDVLDRIWQDAEPKHAGEYLHCISDAMFYFYHIAHMAKHFQVGGCGVRPFLDLWLLNHKVEFDRQAREALLREGGLLRFALAMEEVSEVWFSGQPEKPKVAQISDYILRAGTYGNIKNKTLVAQAQMGSRVRYMLQKRVFAPYDLLRDRYPVLEKHKWLAPLYQMIRWISLINRDRRKNVLIELKRNTEITSEKMTDTADMLKYLGL